MVMSLPACRASSARNYFRSKFMQNHKTLKNSQTAADRRVKHKDAKISYLVGQSNSDTISGEWRRLLLISASGLFCQNEKTLITRKR
jgi:hypothetical protein